jgi:hypothetical protein
VAAQPAAEIEPPGATRGAARGPSVAASTSTGPARSRPGGLKNLPRLTAFQKLRSLADGAARVRMQHEVGVPV